MIGLVIYSVILSAGKHIQFHKDFCNGLTDSNGFDRFKCLESRSETVISYTISRFA
jgi:hypothetical protein